MRGPVDVNGNRTLKGSRTRGRIDRETLPRPAGGKALARIQYFEVQRGLERTQFAAGRVVATMPAPSPAAQRRRGRRTTVSAASLTAMPSYATAFRTKRALEPGFAEAVGVPRWRPLGPDSIPNGQTYGTGGNNRVPVSGRVVGIFVDPTDPHHLVLCSAGGGLWGSQDTGATWHPLTDNAPTLSMGAIAHAPSSPNIVYAATGEGDDRSPLGMGLLRSSDAGLTWSHVASAALRGVSIFDLAVHPTDATRLWAGAVRGLYTSTNGGSTWTRARAVDTYDISVNTANPLEIFAACQDGLFRSGNGGTSWAQVALPGLASGAVIERLEVCHAPSNPGVVYVTAAAGGLSLLWRRAQSNGSFALETPPSGMDVSQAWYDWCFAVSSADPNLVFWGAIELYRGRRSGSGTWQWSNVSSRASGDSIHPDQHHIMFDPVDPKVVYACNDGGVFRSPNLGNGWKAVNPGLSITEFEFLAHLESQDAWLIGGTQDNGTLSDATALSWKQIALGDGGDCGTAEGATPVCYHSYYGMWIERAPALGAQAFRWTDVSPPFAENYPALFYPPMDVLGSVVAKAGITVFVSANSGATWKEVQLPVGQAGTPERASALLVLDARTIFVGMEHGSLYRVRRSASGNWASAIVTTLRSPRAGAFISDIVVVGAASRDIWASCSTFNGGHVFRSTNGGSTWSDRSGNLPDIPVNAIVIDPQNPSRLFAATDHGVYQSLNAGTAWTDFSNGLPNVIVGDLILHTRRRILRAGTRNRGAWEVGL
jgi:hypothetical protein